MPRANGKPVDFDRQFLGKMVGEEAEKFAHRHDHDGAKMMSELATTQAYHHDRLSTLEDHLGLAKKADGFKSEDQEVPKNPERKRH